MKKSILGFFMLFTFYIIFGYYYLNIGIDFVLFTPFYVFFILILSLIPTLSITYRNVLGLGREDNVLLLVNTVHITLVGILILFAVLYNHFIGSVFSINGYLIFVVSLILNIIVLFEDAKEKWAITALIIYTLAFVSLYYVEYLLLWNLLFLYPLPLLYLLLHNVTILSYRILKLR